jgi:phytoene dehydrogenase-like protein
VARDRRGEPERPGTVTGGADALVIGAGHNGLVAANLLADAGWEVLVLEARPEPGGSVRSAELAAPGFVGDVCSAFYPLGLASPVLRSLRLTDHGLRWRHAPEVLAHLLPDGRAAVLSRDPERTAASVEQFAAGDGDRWLAAYARWRQVAPRVLSALFGPFPPVRAAAGLLAALGPADAARAVRELVLPARVAGEERFAGQGARALLAGSALHADLTLEETGGGVYGWLLVMLGQQYGFPVPAGGAGEVTRALLARLRERGGRIETGVRVDRVAVARGRAVGVRATGGQVWRARRAVLADVPAPVLYQDLVGPAGLPARLLADLSRFRWDYPTVRIDWALSGPVPWLHPAAAGAGTLHLGGDVNGMARHAAALARSEMPSLPLLILGQLTTADPARSPPGTELLWGYTRLPHRARWAPETVARQVARVEAMLESYAPGFSKLVAGRWVSDPVDQEAKNPSLVGGALGGGTAAAYQQLLFRPVPGLGRADTPVDRLYLASSSAHPGAGVHGGPGANAARAALARDRALVGGLYAAGVAAAHRAIYRPDPS